MVFRTVLSSKPLLTQAHKWCPKLIKPWFRWQQSGAALLSLVAVTAVLIVTITVAIKMADQLSTDLPHMRHEAYSRFLRVPLEYPKLVDINDQLPLNRNRLIWGQLRSVWNILASSANLGMDARLDRHLSLCVALFRYEVTVAANGDTSYSVTVVGPPTTATAPLYSETSCRENFSTDTNFFHVNCTFQQVKQMCWEAWQNVYALKGGQEYAVGAKWFVKKDLAAVPEGVTNIALYHVGLLMDRHALLVAPEPSAVPSAEESGS